MKTFTCTWILLLFSAILNPLGSATKVWHPEKLIPQSQTTPNIQPTPKTYAPNPTQHRPTRITQPVLKVSKFWHAKLSEKLPPKLEQLETQLRQTYPNAHITISSGYRSKRYNDKLGRRLGFTHSGGRVAKNSAHTRGKAVDLYAYQKKNGKKYVIPHQVVAKHAKKIFNKTIVYNDHVHVEIR